MRLHIGTSGFAYKQWTGPFYPEGIREKEMLAWYAGRLDCVEINNTFYRFPTVAGLTAWAAQVPERFRFAIKAPQRITHVKRLHDVGEDVMRLVDSISTLGPRLGPVLFQFPPRMAPDPGALLELTTHFPPGLRVAFEFRDPRWRRDDIRELLRERGCAICYNDALEEGPQPTADWGYARLRRESYGEADMEIAVRRILAQPWQEAYVFVKHEAPDSPLIAQKLASMFRSQAPTH